MTKLWAICRNTFVQTIRQPIYLVLVLVTFTVLVLDLPLAGWTMGSSYHDTDQKMLVNLGLTTLLMSGLLISAFSASGVLSREIEDRTALTVIAKPVPRSLFVLGKFLGVAAAVAVAFYLCSLVLVMTIRHKVMPAASDPYDWPVIVLGLSALGLAILIAGIGNWSFGWTFTSAAVSACLVLLTAAMLLIAFIGKGWRLAPFGHDINPQILVGLALILMAVLIFVAVAVAASTRLGQVMTLLVCFLAYLGGSMRPHLASISPVFGWPLPDLNLFYVPLDTLVRDATIPGRYVAVAGGYCAAFVAAMLAVGVALFQPRELEAGTSSATLPGAVGLLAWAGRLGFFVMAATAVVILSTAGGRSGGGLPTAVGLLAGATGLWIVWAHFSRGTKWAYWVVLALMLLPPAAWGASLLMPERAESLRLGQGTVLSFAEAVVAAAILVVLLLPKTRHHFASAAAPSRSPQ